MDNYHGPLQKIEVLDTIFMVDKGILKILLLRKETEPYKGYWCLPRGILDSDLTIQEQAEEVASNTAGVNGVHFLNGDMYSSLDRVLDERVLGLSVIGLTDTVTLSLKSSPTIYSHDWFDVTALPKMIYDHMQIAQDSIEKLKGNIKNLDILKKLFPSDFTLPEFQRVLEQITNEEIDRRNFRKKIIKEDILEFTGEHNVGENGRPAKLYRFKETE